MDLGGGQHVDRGTDLKSPGAIQVTVGSDDVAVVEILFAASSNKCLLNPYYTERIIIYREKRKT